MINNIEYLPGIGSSDYVCLCFNLLCYSDYNQVNKLKYRYNLHQANFDKMRQLLQDVDWEDILRPLDIHLAWQLFANKCTDIINNCILMFISKKGKISM